MATETHTVPPGIFHGLWLRGGWTGRRGGCSCELEQARPGPWAGSLNKTTGWAGHRREQSPGLCPGRWNVGPTGFPPVLGLCAHQQGSLHAHGWQRGPRLSPAPTQPPLQGRRRPIHARCHLCTPAPHPHGGSSASLAGLLPRWMGRGPSGPPRSSLHLSPHLHCLLCSPRPVQSDKLFKAWAMSHVLHEALCHPDPLCPLSSPSVWGPGGIWVPDQG